MKEAKLLKMVLSEMSQKELDSLLNLHGLETEMGKELHTFLRREDVDQLMKNRFSLNSSVIPHPDTFKLAIFRFLERQGLRESSLYKQCSIEKDHYYQVRDGKIKRYKHKGLFFQFALVLRLDYYEAVYLLNLAGHHFMPWMYMRDYIIAFCLYHQKYDFDEVSDLLEKYGAESLYT